MIDDNPSARLLQALASLNTISKAINNLDAKTSQSIEEILGLIGRSAVKMIPGSSAILYAYDETHRQFTACSSVTAEEDIQYVPDRAPREYGLGARAIHLRQAVVSYSDASLQLNPKMITKGVKTGAAFPLIVGEAIVGLLYIYLYEERHFSALELLLLENFVNQAAMAIFHAHRSASADQHLARKEEENARLRRAGMLISSRLDLQETLDTILQMALEVLDAHYGVFRLVDPKGEVLVSAAFAGEFEHAPVSEDLRIDEHSIMGWVAKHRQSLCIADVKQPPWSGIYHPLYRDLEMRSELSVPLISASGRLEGVLNLESPRVAAFSEADSHLLHAFATQATIAIQEVKLLESLKEISESILQESLSPVLDQIVCKVIELVNAVDCGIWLLDHQKLTLAAGSSGVVPLGELSPQHSLLNEVLLESRMVPVESMTQIKDWWLDAQQMPTHWRHGMLLPLRGGDRQHQHSNGVLCVFYAGSEPVRFSVSSWDEKVISILAHYAVLAFQNRDAIEAVQHAQNQTTLVETFAALGDVAANLLHQLNNKFGTIPVRVQGLQNRYAALLAHDPYLQKNLSAIEESARQAMDIMQENLHLLHPIQKQSVYLAECLRDTLQNCQIPSSITIELDNLDNLPPVHAGYQVLRMVFSNLIDNAVHAMQDHGLIRIKAQQGEGSILVMIEDNGPGIPDEIQRKIFDFQFSRSHSQIKQRMGFGLWWVRTIMARLGGSVSVQSDGQHGTIFSLQFPVERSEG